MAELNVADKGGKGKKVRSKKQNPAVDLTAMVDLAFLLITFFMLTTTLSKPQSMELAMPDEPKVDAPPPPETPAWRTLTIVLGEDDKIAWYGGGLDNPQPNEEPTIVGYGKEGIRQVILRKSQAVKARATKPDETLVILIKPSEKSTYKNLVDILDEMAITQEKKYAIVDMTEEDVMMLTEKNAY